MGNKVKGDEVDGGSEAPTLTEHIHVIKSEEEDEKTESHQETIGNFLICSWVANHLVVTHFIIIIALRII